MISKKKFGTTVTAFGVAAGMLLGSATPAHGRKLQRQESSNQTFLIKESTNLESTVVPRAAVLFLILIVKKKM